MLYIMANHMVESDCVDNEMETFTFSSDSEHIHGYTCEKLRKTEVNWLNKVCNGVEERNGNKVCPLTCNRSDCYYALGHDLLEYRNEHICDDDEDKTFTHTTDDVYGFDCEKLRKIKNPVWLDSVCNGNGIPNGNEVCPVTCNVCTSCATCYDKKDEEEVIKYKYHGSGRLIFCKSLTKAYPSNLVENTHNEWTVDWRCNKIPKIRTSCPESCKVCKHCVSPSPSTKPSSNPTSTPNADPSSAPSSHPSITSSSSPSVNPTSKPTLLPSVSPSVNPSSNPTSTSTLIPCATCWDKKDEEDAVRYTYDGNPSLIHCKALQRPFPSTTNKNQINPSQAHNEWTVDWRCNKIPEIRKSCPESCKICAHCTIPSLNPSSKPTSTPTVDPSSAPSDYPSITSSSLPSVNPTSKPTLLPSVSPSTKPTTSPHSFPSSHPTTKPSSNPTSQPTPLPSMTPTTEPTATISLAPTADIATITECFNKYAKGLNTKTLNFADTLLFVSCYNAHSLMPSTFPSISPTAVPSEASSSKPSVMPSSTPTVYPSHAPSKLPTMHPTSGPSSNPSVISSTVPSTNPSHSSDPSASPTNCESKKDSVAPFSYQYKNHPLKKITCKDLEISHPFAVEDQRKTIDNWYVDYRCYEVPEVLFSCPKTCRLCVPSSTPSSTPSALPTSAPTPIPSIVPTIEPTPLPSKAPSLTLSLGPTIVQSTVPSISLTLAPSQTPSSKPTVVPSVTTTHVPSATVSQSPIPSTASTECIDRKDSNKSFTFVNPHGHRVKITCKNLYTPYYAYNHHHWHLDSRCSISRKIREKYCPEKCKACVNSLSSMATYNVTETHFSTNRTHVV